MTDERYAWLRKELAKPTKLDAQIERCEKARDAAHDPDMKIIWEGKVRELRNKKYVALDKLRRINETF